MIPTHPQWSARIGEYAKFVLDDDAIRRNWFEKTNRDSSIIGPSELIEQVFTDLVADEGLANLSENVGSNDPLYGSIKAFIEDLDRLCDARPDEEGPSEVKDVLRSAEWQAVRRSAARVLQALS